MDFVANPAKCERCGEYGNLRVVQVEPEDLDAAAFKPDHPVPMRLCPSCVDRIQG